jgi:hypothetical protein
MIQLFEVIPGPSGEHGLYGRLAVDSIKYDGWHAMAEDAELAARHLCKKLWDSGTAAQVIVVRTDYESVQDVARRRPLSRQTVASFSPDGDS